MTSVLFRVLLVAVAGWVVIIAASGVGEAAKGSPAMTLVAAEQPDAGQGSGVDVTRLPIGDGRVTQRAVAGNVWACQTSFQVRDALQDGEWFNYAEGTYDSTKKPVVDGSVAWPSWFTVGVEGESRVVRGNGLPNHPTGSYPIARTDDAFAYDRNPNGISAQNVMLRLPVTPALAAEPSCVGMGPIGVLLTGSVFFNALDAAGKDGVAHEIQDACQGHPEMRGTYHYHNLTSCIDDAGTGHSALVGYAFDGFGIYGTRGEDGRQLTDAALDECHGHTHAVEWDGKTVEMYHYHATAEYPYTVGCYRGTVVRLGR